jgi:HAD hydrolase, family IA, variant 3
MIEGAIFDFDGTLFDSMYIWEEVGEDLLKSLNKKAKPGFREKIKPMSLWQSASYCKEEYYIELSVEEIIEKIKDIVSDHYVNKIEPKPYVKDFLESFLKKDIKMCIATVSDKALIESALKRCNLEKYFTDVLDCKDIPEGKQSPEIYLKALEVLGSKPENTCVFEDAAHAISTAKSAEFIVAAIYDSFENDQNMVRRTADIYLENYKDVDKFWKFVS